MLAFFSIVSDSRSCHTITEGTLFSLPPELKDKFRLEKYLSIKEQGWSTTEFGYSALVRVDGFGNKYVLPGLYLSDAPAPKKKFYGYKPIFSRKQVEEYLDEHLNRNASIQEKSESELTTLVHDLRHLSSSIYHSAIQAEIAYKEESVFKGNGHSLLGDSIKTVIATQTMLKVRIDYLDFVNNTDRFDERERIPVYSRVDKVIRCFRASAKDKGINILLAGSSYRLANGPNILDIVPYTLIDNAIKYSPRGMEILVKVFDTVDRTIVSVTSTGPKLEGAEIESIFGRGFRGKNAIAFRNSGTERWIQRRGSSRGISPTHQASSS